MSNLSYSISSGKGRSRQFWSVSLPNEVPCTRLMRVWFFMEILLSENHKNLSRYFFTLEVTHIMSWNSILNSLNLAPGDIFVVNFASKSSAPPFKRDSRTISYISLCVVGKIFRQYVYCFYFYFLSKSK